MKKTELYSKYYEKLEKICKKIISDNYMLVNIIEKTFDEFLLLSFHKSHKEKVWMHILYELVKKNIKLEHCFSLNSVLI